MPAINLTDTQKSPIFIELIANDQRRLTHRLRPPGGCPVDQGDQDIGEIFRRRGRTGLIAGAAILASVAGLAVSTGVPAQASSTPPGNSIIVGSGSQTAYEIMNSFDDLFNTAQGCDGSRLLPRPRR